LPDVSEVFDLSYFNNCLGATGVQLYLDLDLAVGKDIPKGSQLAMEECLGDDLRRHLQSETYLTHPCCEDWVKIYQPGERKKGKMEAIPMEVLTEVGTG
jgi:hypothetical protein